VRARVRDVNAVDKMEFAAAMQTELRQRRRDLTLELEDALDGRAKEIERLIKVRKRDLEIDVAQRAKRREATRARLAQLGGFASRADEMIEAARRSEPFATQTAHAQTRGRFGSGE
jgi:hypothetical protein